VEFQKATKRNARARVALIGPSGSGKTFTALRIACALGQRVAVIDTEHGSASKYADRFNFDVLELEDFAPQQYVEAIKAAEVAGYDVLVIDSLSHAWAGKGGALEMVDRAAERGGNSYAAWRNVTPWHNRLVDSIIACRCHVIATMRAKTDYVIEQDGKGGKTTIRKVGLAPVQRDGMEYEFDVTADLSPSHSLLVGKTRCPELDGKSFSFPGEDVAEILKAWLTDGAPMLEREPAPEFAPSQVTQDAGLTQPFPGEIKARVIAAQRSMSEEFRLTPADIKAATSALLAQEHIPNLDALTEEQADALISCLAEWANDQVAAKEPVEEVA
jgi:hypothetical protein